MSAVRQSKRLKVAAGHAASLTTTSTSTSTISTPTRRKTTTKATTRTIVAATEEVGPLSPSASASASIADDIPRPAASPQPASATKTTKKRTKNEDTDSDAASAWGALFKKPQAKASSLDARPMPRAATLTPELEKQITDFPKFDGIADRTTPSATRIVAWNINGVRSVLKQQDSLHMRAYAAQEDADVLCFGETKICAVELQKLEDFLPQYKYQYWACATKKGYSGTAILSKQKPLSVKDSLVVDGKADDEGRFLALEFAGFWLVHTYVPNSGAGLVRLDFRTKQWDTALLAMMKELEKTKPVVWCGDLNVAHQEIDIHDPKSNKNKSAGFTDAERESFSNVLANGFVDTYRHFYPDTKQYSYWTYKFQCRAKNKGWRLDYVVVSKSLVGKVATAFVRDKITGSDHVPVGIDLTL